jgi:hypothetical protein
MARYRAIKKTYLSLDGREPRVIPIGTEFEWAGRPNRAMEPLDDAARDACARAGLHRSIAATFAEHRGG